MGLQSKGGELRAQDIIIGSGPSGVAAAAALVARGRDVLMLDAGLQMDGGARDLRDRMGATEPDAWSAADREAIGAVRRSEKSDSIRPFGSDFLFRPASGMEALAEPASVHGLRPSFARGGLSNGWGASTLPYQERDFDRWPIGLADLVPHYRAVAPMLGVAERRDGLADLFADVEVDERPLPQSRQAAELLRRMERNRASLARRGVYFGTSRQAIAEGCRACAMCHYGCPYGLIFSAGREVDRMVAAGMLRYRGGVVARGFAETSGGVTVQTDDERFEGERLFIACGLLPTALLALSSLGLENHEVTILDSQHFYLPMLHRWSAGDPASEPRHTLAQLFWEIDDPAVDAHLVHAQIYTYNDTYAPDMRQRFGPFAGLARPLIEAMSRRLIVAQAFLHSDASPAIGARLDGNGLTFRRIANERTDTAITRASGRVARAARIAGLVPLTPLLRPGGLGTSFHCGGSFPMRQSPGAGETDILGRPAGLRRTHIVDASIFPTVPASTITFSVMANSHRIASEA